jgi:predicted O-methyltransferase YrrM
VDHTYEGVLADIKNGLPMLRPNGLILVHDVDPNRVMNEQTEAHPHPVYEEFNVVIDEYRFEWVILKFIRKRLA